MADITAKLIIYRVNETLTNMAERLPKFLYTDDTRQRYDIINMLFVGWILLGVFVYFLGTFIASRLPRTRTPAIPPLADNAATKGTAPVIGSDQTQSEVPKVAAKPSSTGGGGRRRQFGEYGGREQVPTGPQYPVSVGPDGHSVLWVNDVLVWLFTKANVASLAEGWMGSLNDRTIKSSPEHGILVEFDRVQSICPQPEMLDVRTDAESNNNVTINCRLVAQQLGLVITATRNTGKQTTSVEYELLLERLDGKIRVACTTEDSLLVIRFVEQPDVKLSLKPSTGAVKFQSLDQRALEDAIVDIIMKALGSAVVDLHLAQEPDFPKYPKRKPGSESVFTPQNPVSAVARHERRLLVKVIKATNIGGKKGCQEPFCVVEMDDPPQRHQTSSLKDTNSPFWDEHFLFNLKNTSAELLFEIYDRGKKTGENFLGLGIVSVEELQKNPSQRQIITMQSRPLEKDSVTGALTVEFLFMEGSEIPIKGSVETNSRVTPAGTVITTTTIKNTGEDGSFACHEDRLHETWLMGMTPHPLSVTTLTPQICPPSRSTLSEPCDIPVESKTPTASFEEIGKLSPANSEVPTISEMDSPGFFSDETKYDVPTNSEFTGLAPAEFEVPTALETEFSGPSSTKSELDLTSPITKPPVVIGVHLKKASPASPEKRRTFPRTSPRARGVQSKNPTTVDTKKIFLETMINGDTTKGIEASMCPRLGTLSAPNPIWSTHPQLKSELLLENEDFVCIPTITSTSETLGNSNTEESTNNHVQDGQNLSNAPAKILKISASYPSQNMTTDESTNPQLLQEYENIVHLPTIPSDSAKLENSAISAKKESTDTEDVKDGPAKTLKVDVLLASVKNGNGETESPSIQLTPPTPLIYPTFPRHASKKLRIKYSSMENLEQDANNVANTALRELENRGKPTAGMAPSKSTLIVHSVQREVVRPLVKVKLDKDGRWHEVEQANGEGKDSPSSKSDRGSLLASSSPSASERNDMERARSKERKSFMGTLRKRLSFKKNRSKSMEQKDESLPESLASSRSVSADRSRSVPSSRETSTPRVGVGRLDVPDTHVLRSRLGARLDNSSTRSSVSEGSAVSGASSRTYINENSTLIIEATENGVTKYYLIPFSLASRSKWRKKGVKLHVYNDHTFVAKHVTGPTVCQACTRRFSRRPGKQGYECRDCSLQCHKTCHVKVESRCPHSTIHSLEMEYVQDPKAKAKIS